MSNHPIEAIIFDMDGLLLDSEVYWEQARRGYCASIGCTWTAEHELSVKGANSPEWAHRIEEVCGARESSDLIIRGVVTRMEALYRTQLPLLPGAVSTVTAAASKYPLAVASSSPLELIEYVLLTAGIRDCFEEVLSADAVGRGKPNPDVFLAVAAKIDRLPERCAVFEDSSAGIAAALAAGMFVIAVPNPHYPPDPEVLSRANIVLESLNKFSPAMLGSRGHVG